MEEKIYISVVYYEVHVKRGDKGKRR